MLINLKSYDLHVKWMPGSTMLIADQLSRSMDISMVHIESNHDKIMNFVEYENVNLTENLAISKERL